MNAQDYLDTVEQIKSEIRAAQYKAAVSVNQELILLYHSIGEVINAHKVWGNKFIENLAKDIKLAFPDTKGYSVRNLKYMAKFALTYPDRQFVQTVSAQIPWSHHVAILDKVKEADQRIWYIQAKENDAGAACREYVCLPSDGFQMGSGRNCPRAE